MANVEVRHLLVCYFLPSACSWKLGTGNMYEHVFLFLHAVLVQNADGANVFYSKPSLLFL